MPVPCRNLSPPNKGPAMGQERKTWENKPTKGEDTAAAIPEGAGGSTLLQWLSMALPHSLVLHAVRTVIIPKGTWGTMSLSLRLFQASPVFRLSLPRAHDPYQLEPTHALHSCPTPRRSLGAGCCTGQLPPGPRGWRQARAPRTVRRTKRLAQNLGGGTGGVMRPCCFSHQKTLSSQVLTKIAFSPFTKIR